MRLPWPIRFFFRKIKHFWQWAPVIWKDEDWDPAYLYEIMRFKISKIRVDMEKANRHTTVEHDVKKMKIVEELLHRHAFSDFYHNNRFDHDHQGLCKCKEDGALEKDCWEEIQDNDNVHLGMRWKNPFCQWCQVRKVVNMRMLKENEDFDMLWDLMRKHSRRWWN